MKNASAAKRRIMAAQRGARRVEPILWRPTQMPRRREGQQPEGSFAIPRSKLVANSIQDDDHRILLATPHKWFKAAMKDLTHSEDAKRAIALNTLRMLGGPESAHALMPEARFAVGECYLYGRGARADKHRAVHWFRSVRPGIWPRGLLETPGNAQAHAMFCLGEHYEVGGGGVLPDPHKALHWYAKAANKGHPRAALCAAEILCYARGENPRRPAFEQFGREQTRRIACAAGSVRVRRSVDRRGRGDSYLTYFSDAAEALSSKAGDAVDVFRRAAGFFDAVLNLTSPEPTSGATALSCSNDQNCPWVANYRALRCRALFGLAVLAQEGRLDDTGGPAMPKAVRLMTEALRTAGDHRGLACLLAGVPATASVHDSSRSGAASIPLFSLALCYHFGRGVPQDIPCALRIYSEFLLRAEASPEEAALGPANNEDADPSAGHIGWRILAQKLSTHCRVLRREQESAFIKAAVALEGC